MHVIIEHIVYSAQMYENIFSQRSNWFSGHQGTPGCDGTSRQSRKKSEYKKCPAYLVIPFFGELFVVCSTKSTQARHYCSFSKRLGGCSQWVNSVEAVDSIKYKCVIRKCLYSAPLDFSRKGFVTSSATTRQGTFYIDTWSFPTLLSNSILVEHVQSETKHW